jgi:hypothetical protein
MSIKLTDTQIALLSAGAQRDDRCLVPPQNLRSGAAQKVAAKLIDACFVKERSPECRCGGKTSEPDNTMR